MKFTVNSTQLQRVLSSISGAIASNPIIPILSHFLFQLENGILRVTASDLQITIITELDVVSKDRGFFTIPSRILIDTLRSLQEQPITILINDDLMNVSISTDNGIYKITGELPGDYPQIPTIDGDGDVTLSSDVLAKAISNSLFAVSSDELRPAMTGLFLELGQKELSIAATDGHRLIQYTRSDVASDRASSMIIPKKSMTILKGLLPINNTDVLINFDSKNATIKFGKYTVVSRLIDEKFPDYRNVIPVKNDILINLDRAAFLCSLKRIAIYADKTTHLVKLSFVGNQLTVSSEDIHYNNEGNERMTCDKTGVDVKIGFNSKFLIEMVSTITSAEITLNLRNASTGALLKPTELTENEGLQMLLMPVMITESVAALA